MLQKGAEGICGTKAEGKEEAENYVMTYKGKVFCVHDMKTYKGLDIWLQPFLISTLVGGEWLNSRPGPSTSWTGFLYFLSRKVGRPQSHFVRFGEHKHLLHLPGFEPRTVHHERSRYTFITYAPSKKKII
jgi:hypothetical protein